MRPQVIAFFFFWSKKFANKQWNKIISNVALNLVDKILSTKSCLKYNSEEREKQQKVKFRLS